MNDKEVEELKKAFQDEIDALCDRITALETAGRKLVNSLPTHELDLARDAWGHTNANVVLSYKNELAAVLDNIMVK